MCMDRSQILAPNLEIQILGANYRAIEVHNITNSLVWIDFSHPKSVIESCDVAAPVAKIICELTAHHHRREFGETSISWKTREAAITSPRKSTHIPWNIWTTHVGQSC